MKYTEDDIRRIKNAAEGRLLDVVQDFHQLRKSGSDYVGDCPHCHAAKKFTVAPNKDIFKCFSCNEISGKGAISYLMTAENMSYLDAMDYLVRKFSVILDAKPEKKPVKLKVPKKKSKEAAGQNTDSFCAKMLAASGLTFADVMANVYKSTDTKAIFQGPTFKPGSIDSKGCVTATGDDVIIEYYDLEGMPVTYMRSMGRKAESVKTEYFRVRWQFPEMHKDKDGKPFKYRSPVGSGTPIYIPDKIRQMYKNGTSIPTLYIQEGEKKAEKACKHGIPSIAVSGIQNLGTKGNLPEDFIRLITTCQVKEVVFIFDSDWDDISTNIKINDQVEKRPRNFFFAARNFKDYMRALKNRDLYVEAYVGHVNKNSAGDKGIDDLLANTLHGHEEKLAEDIHYALNDKKGLGKYVEIFKITTWTDFKLMELWGLHSHEAFAQRHKDILKELPEFVFGRYRWKFDDNGKVVLAQPFDEDEKFWIETKKNEGKDNEKTVYEFGYLNSQNFLQNRGFGRLKQLDGSFKFIQVENPIVRSIEASDARDYLYQFARHNCKKEIVEMLIKGITQYLGPDKLSLLDYLKPNFLKPNKMEQYFYFAKNCWLVTANEVKEMGYESISHQLWEEDKKEAQSRYIGKPLIKFYYQNGICKYEMTEDAKKCHFLQFLKNTSDFTWRKTPEEISEEEINENNLHFLSKLCAIGFMSLSAKDNSVARAVIGMDGKQSEVGESNGRSGKSLVGELMRHVVPLVYISGKKNDIFSDQFIWNDVQENTKLVFIDDVLQGFDLEFLFPNITGDWTVNCKGGRRFTLPFEKSPKLYITTNHAIRGNGNSFKDRQWLIAFSDFYNDTHKPIDDFGVMFFSEWDYDQWNLTWNMLANCIQLYLKFGVVQAPGERLEQRRIRQEIGEVMISWADEYYSDEKHINVRIPRKELWDSFCTYDPAQRKFCTPTLFKKKVIMYCAWKGWVFNPQKYDSVTKKPFNVDKDGKPVIDDKSGGVEYFTVGKEKGAIIQPATDPMGVPVTEDQKLDF